MTVPAYCCQRAFVDGETAEEHFPRCDARAEDPPLDALFEITPPAREEGGPLL
ncbi:hypothetical protein ACFYUV_20785 [Nonomuraea sp. NPDC003560]|uniref:hypothetical protein n=1 Tax=Nonomuraea sp. NPDC003560 TaxID=3364341 RepID=UPI00368CD8D8